jgi:Putative prokaryotic signal transducing protein
MDSEDLVTLCTVQNPTEAELIRSALEAVGIACMIGGESQAGLVGVLAIDVLVHASDEEAARKHLRNLHQDNLQREKRHAEAKQGKETPTDVSEAIQEMPSGKQPSAEEEDE